jgi:putative chitobiose transport system permease protein
MSFPPRPYRPWTPYAFVAPAAVVLGVFVIAAAGQVLAYSFARYNAFRGPDPVGLLNYQKVVANDTFWYALGNSFLYLLVTPAVMVVSLAAALVVHCGIRGGHVLRVLLFLPVVTPAIVAGMSFRLLFNEDAGLINRGFEAVGLAKEPWLTVYPYTLISAMTVTLWKGFGYYMMIFLAGLLSVPRELEEAAIIDGAGRGRVFWHIVLPTLRPLLILVAVISSISALKVFDELYVTIEGAPQSHQTVVPLIFRTLTDGDYGLASAIGVVLFAIVLMFSLVQLWVVRNRE